MGGIRIFIRPRHHFKLVLEADDKMGALAGIVVGAVTVVIWAAAGLSDFLYEMIPGFAASLLSVYAASILTSKPNQKVAEQFENIKM